jgi:hypothetical protein
MIIALPVSIHRSGEEKKPTSKKVGRCGEFAISEELQITHSPLNIFQFACMDSLF